MILEYHGILQDQENKEEYKICCVIQDIYSETRVYTPGSRGRAHPTPDETIPTTITLPLR